jgi:pyruvate dehydrogenase E2 component (dihydrolipoamide acetyltransferase)/2-oxoisovalerate dehydrogenase E2 component (dihydrolipoyl transacylase)
MNFLLPDMGEAILEVELVEWLVKPGDSVRRGQDLMEVMTDKAVMPVPSPFEGTVESLFANRGDKVLVGQAVLSYVPSASHVEVAKPDYPRPATAPAPSPARAPSPVANAVRARGAGVPVKAAPSVRYMARKLGIDLERVSGSGEGGRILIEDLSARITPAPAAQAGPTDGRTAVPDYGTPGTRIEFAGVRRRIAERMVESMAAIPHYSYVDECEVTQLVALREGLRRAAAATAPKVTYLAFFVRAVAAALVEVPIVNASLDEEAGAIVLHDRYDVGIAVAAPQGLLVPVIRGAERKDVFQIARDIERLSADVRAGRARVEDLKGSTFTITSIGGIGGLISTPIINQPEVGILGLGRVIKRPVYDAAGNLRPADLMYVSFSFDHRVVDGAVGAAFSNAVIRQIQNPAALLVPGAQE